MAETPMSASPNYEWEPLLVECFRDVALLHDYSGNFVLDKMFAIWMACRQSEGPEEVEFDKQFKELYCAKKLE